MKFYIGANSDGSEIIAKMPLKRYIDYETNKKDVLSYNDTKKPLHWILDFTGIEVPRLGFNPVDQYLTLPKGSLKSMFGVDMTWDDDFRAVTLP